MIIELAPLRVLALSIVVLWTGEQLTARIPFLQRLSISIAVTSRFVPSPKAFLVIPLVGAFLLDIINAFVIQSCIEMSR